MTKRPDLGTPVPVVRIFDQRAAYDFYLDYLGFAVEWEHRFEPELPLYARIRRDKTVLDLSEHHGDGTPGTVLWIPVKDVWALHAELDATTYPKLRPGVDPAAPGGPTLTVLDPFGNSIRFSQAE